MKDKFIQKALSTIKSGEEILKTLTVEKVQTIHASHDLSEEVGELQSAIKKHVFYNQDLDRDNVIEELGDILANIHKIIFNLKLEESEIYERAINKINKRYPGGYSDLNAKLRMDKG